MMEIRKDVVRQFTPEEDHDIDVIWLRLPDANRRALLKLLNTQSRDSLLAAGLTDAESTLVFSLIESLY